MDLMDKMDGMDDVDGMDRFDDPAESWGEEEENTTTERAEDTEEENRTAEGAESAEKSETRRIQKEDLTAKAQRMQRTRRNMKVFNYG